MRARSEKGLVLKLPHNTPRGVGQLCGSALILRGAIGVGASGFPTDCGQCAEKSQNLITAISGGEVLS